MEEIYALSQKPYSPESLQELQLLRAKSFEFFPTYRVFSSMLLPSLHSVIIKGYRRTGELRIAQTSLAIELYRLEHSRLPDQLTDLVPTFLPEIPVSPFTGEPLQYEHGKITSKVPAETANNSRKYQVMFETLTFEGYTVSGAGDPELCKNQGTTYATLETLNTVWKRRMVTTPADE